ncbi:MAG: hypothetical protein ACFFE8_17550 [Candidatus Heimdallarchaeota archaeon]
MEERTKKPRIGGTNLTALFLEVLDQHHIPWAPLTVRGHQNTFIVNKVPCLVAYSNSSRKLNFKRYFWGLKKEALMDICRRIKGAVIFLGGRNLGKQDKQKGETIPKLSSDARTWLRSDFIEHVFIFSAQDLSEKLRSLDPPKGNFKFNFFLETGKFTGQIIELFSLERREVQSQILNRYDLLGLPPNAIHSLLGIFKPFFLNFERPGKLITEILPQGFQEIFRAQQGSEVVYEETGSPTGVKTNILLQPTFYVKKTPAPCVICRLPIQLNEESTRCPSCHRSFHLTHFAEWVRQKGTCPYCQEQIGIV